MNINNPIVVTAIKFYKHVLYHITVEFPQEDKVAETLAWKKKH